MFENYYSNYYTDHPEYALDAKHENEDDPNKMPETTMLSGRDVDTPEKREKHTICIIGYGRGGLTNACLFADAGFKVTYVDADHKIVNQIEKGRVSSAGKKPSKHIKDGRLTVERSIRKATSSSDIIIFSLPVTIDKRRKPDYSYIVKACREIGLSLRPGSLFIFASTVGPGVTESLVKETLEDSSGLEAGSDFGLAYGPISAQILQSNTVRRVHR